MTHSLSPALVPPVVSERPVSSLFEAKDMWARPLTRLTPARQAVLWDRLSRFPILFATEQETTFQAFRDIMEDPNTVLIDFMARDLREPLGLGMVYDIVPGVEAKIQVSFFDSKLKGREPIARAFVGWIFQTLLTRRTSAHVRADAKSMRAFLERVGMYFEGVLKNWVRRDTRLYDMYLYGVTNTECDEHWLAGRSWAKARVKPLEAYEVR